MKLNLEDKTVLVTGAGTGIGREKTGSYITGSDYCVYGGYGD